MASAIVSDLQDFIGPRSLYLKPCKKSYFIHYIIPQLIRQSGQYLRTTNLEHISVLIPAFLPHILQLVLVAVGSARHTCRG